MKEGKICRREPRLVTDAEAIRCKKAVYYSILLGLSNADHNTATDLCFPAALRSHTGPAESGVVYDSDRRVRVKVMGRTG
jgi:hypothetical protein